MTKEKTTKLTVVTPDEVSKVENNVLNVGQLQYLFQKTPAAHTYTRPGKGGETWSYVTGTYMKKVLNLMFGWNWSFTVEKFDINMDARQAIVLGKLTVKTGGEEVIKMQFGRVDLKFRKNTDILLDLGNDLKAATTDALKKCASELGIAGDIYGANEFKSIKIVESKPSAEQLRYLEELVEQCKLTEAEEHRVKFTLPTDSMKDVQRKIDLLVDYRDEQSIEKRYDIALRFNP